MRKSLLLAEISSGSPTLLVVEMATLVMRTSSPLVTVSEGFFPDEAFHYRYPQATGVPTPPVDASLVGNLS